MQVTRTDKSPTQVILKVTADEKDLAPIKAHVLTHFTSSVKVPGFRAGTAPSAVLEKHIDQQALQNELLEHAVNDLYRRAAQGEKLRPVASPQVQIKKFVPYTQLEFEAEVTALGQVSLPNYKSIKLSKPKVTVTSKDVDGIIKSLQARMAERKEVERPAKKGDEVVIDFTGNEEDGKPVKGAVGKEHPLLLGSGTFIPGFEEQLIGLSADQTKEFTLTFPKDYGVKGMQSKKVKFHVSLKKVQEMVEPKIDNDFASKAGPFKTVAQLKVDIKKQVQLEKQRQADRDYENELIGKIVAKATAEIPESLIDEQVLSAEEEEKRNLVYRGQTWQEHLKQEGLTEEQHRARQRPDAEARVKAGLILSEIAEKEGIEVADQEVDERIKTLKTQYQDADMQGELDKPQNRQDIAARILTEKTIQILKDYASR
ncbi:MAG: trigger factor [Candidatus Saccharimonadales bacterium]